MQLGLEFAPVSAAPNAVDAGTQSAVATVIAQMAWRMDLSLVELDGPPDGVRAILHDAGTRCPVRHPGGRESPDQNAARARMWRPPGPRRPLGGGRAGARAPPWHRVRVQQHPRAARRGDDPRRRVPAPPDHGTPGWDL